MRNIRLALALIACAWFAGAAAQYVPIRNGLVTVASAPAKCVGGTNPGVACNDGTACTGGGACTLDSSCTYGVSPAQLVRGSATIYTCRDTNPDAYTAESFGASFSDSAGLAALLSDEEGASGGFLRSSAAVLKNSSLVTVCASGCNYSTIQSALDGTTGTSAQPVTILLMPGTYSECVNVDETDDYKTLASLGLHAAKVSCTTDAEYAFQYTGSSGADLDKFVIEGLYIETTGSSAWAVEFQFSGLGDARGDLTVARSKITSANSGNGIRLWGAYTTSPTKSPSELVIYDNEISAGLLGVSIGQHMNVNSSSNVIRMSTTASPEGKCFGDHGITALFSGTTFRSYNDDCEATSQSTGAAEIDTACGVCFYVGLHDNLVVGMRVKATMTGAFSDAPKCWTIGTTTTTITSGHLEVVDSTCDYTTGDAAQIAKAVTIWGGARTTLRNVRISGSGPGTEYDVFLHSGSTSVGWVRYEGLVYDTISKAGSAKFQALNPKVIKSFLRAVDSVALPATGAPLDANSEYGLFDAAADENRSWRNERVSDLYDADSLHTPQFRVYWKPDSATAEDVVWRVGICAAAQDAAFPCTVASFSSVTDTVTGGAAGDLYVSDWTSLPSGILTAGYGLVVTVSRDADNGTDDMTGDAALVGVEISYGVK